jgi:hypothetical protein
LTKQNRLILKQDLGAYFEYHPPVTQERKDAHARANKSALVGFRNLRHLQGTQTEIEAAYDILMNDLQELVKEPYYYKWAHGALIEAKQAALTDCIDREEKIFMHIQQFRMFVNQAITIQELDGI